MTHHPVWAILRNELNVVTRALNDLEPPANMDDLDDLTHWAGRLRDVGHAFQSLGQVIKAATAKEDKAPFDMRAWALLNDAHMGPS